MPIDVFSFLWHVHEHGHKWIQARVYENDGDVSRLKGEPEWVLTEDIAIGDVYRAKRYPPLDEAKGLFRAFAGLPHKDRDALLAFADRYGQLGIGRPTDRAIERDGKRLMSVFVETWEDWKREIIAMRRAVEIWDMFQKRDANGLSHFIRWNEQKDGGRSQWVYWSHPEVRDRGNEALLPLVYSGETVFNTGIDPVLDLFKPGDVLVPASFLVQRWINDHLKGTTSPQLRYDLKHDKRAVQIIPENLLAAMWLQFARSIEGNTKYRACKECGRLFELSTEADGFRISRVFCSDPCKSKDYRRRKERAMRMRTEGRSVASIAKELGKDIETIKKWTTKRKG